MVLSRASRPKDDEEEDLDNLRQRLQRRPAPSCHEPAWSPAGTGLKLQFNSRETHERELATALAPTANGAMVDLPSAFGESRHQQYSPQAHIVTPLSDTPTRSPNRSPRRSSSVVSLVGVGWLCLSDVGYLSLGCATAWRLRAKQCRWGTDSLISLLLRGLRSSGTPNLNRAVKQCHPARRA